jgi:putative DNA primase/helicase
MTSLRIVSDVSLAARGQWPTILTELGLSIPKRGQHGPCPTCGGKDRFRLDDKEGRGTWICSQCGAGDGLTLLAKATRKSTKEAAQEVASLLGLSPAGLDAQEVAARRQQAEQVATKAREDEEKAKRKACIRAASIMGDCIKGHSPYLSLKHLPDWLADTNQTLIREAQHNFSQGSLVIPLTDENDQLVNVQLIDSQGEKRYLAGGQKAGAFHRLTGGLQAAICEGYATGVSVHLATEATVYCAMDASNLQAVAEIAQRREGKGPILIAGDNDLHIDGNPGQAKAQQAAAVIGGLVSLPHEAGDWNDYHQAHGLLDTKKAIMTSYADTKTPTEQTPTVQELPDNYSMGKERLSAMEWRGKGEEAERVPVPISSPLHVRAITHTEQGQGFGRLLEWRDTNGKIRRWAMPMRMLVHKGGEEVFGQLAESGLSYINMSKKNLLRDYLMSCQPQARITCVERTGWHKRAYVLPNGNLGPDANEVILQTTGYVNNDFTTSGTLAEWQAQVAALAVDNSRLAFSLSCAFAAPLLSLIGVEGGGFHLKGESTDGKTTVMMAAASVYGSEAFAHTWRATGNAIEGIASRRNDALLCLDEIKEVDGREAGLVAYMLANGQGKGRSRQDGELRERKQWRLLFLSTGELSLEDHAEQAGQRTFAGMEIRTIQIPSDTGKHGAFEELHGMANGRQFADTLRERLQGQHGTAFRAYVEALAHDLNEHSAWMKAEIRRLITTMTPEGAGNQVGRAINRFALVAAAGELATRLGITGWATGEAIKATQACLDAWLVDRGHLGNQEDAATLRQIRQFFTSHQYSRFADWDDPNHRPAQMVGYRKSPQIGNDEGVLFFVLPEGWREINKGRDYKKAAKLALDTGWIVRNQMNKTQGITRLPYSNGKPIRVYIICDQVISPYE